MAPQRPSFVTPSALLLPIFKELANRRVILASASPRRKDIFETAVCAVLAPVPRTVCRYASHGLSRIQDSRTDTELQGLRPEIVPSTFAEDLPHDQYADNLADYPIATAGEKVRSHPDGTFANRRIADGNEESLCEAAEGMR